MPLDGQQQVDEAPHDVRPDGLGLERTGQQRQRLLVDRDGEMVGPEMHEPFGKRRGRGHCAAHAGGHVVAQALATVAGLALAQGRAGVGSAGGVGSTGRLAAIGERTPFAQARGVGNDPVGASGQVRPGRRHGHVLLALLEQPALRIGGQRVAGAHAQAEAVRRNARRARSGCRNC